MNTKCEFCGEEIKKSFCDCEDSLHAIRHMVNIFECLNHCDRMLKDVENDDRDLTDEQIEKIILMCEEEKKRLKLELDDLLNEVK